MNIDTKKLLEALKESKDKKVELDKDFFIKIIETLDDITSIKVEELFNPHKRTIYSSGNQTVINSGEFLASDSQYNKLNGEILVEARELRCLIKDNIKLQHNIKQLEGLTEKLKNEVRCSFDKIKTIRELKELSNPYHNSLQSNVKVNLDDIIKYY